MAPNGTSRKSRHPPIRILSSVIPASHISSNNNTMSTAPAATSKPIKSEDAVPLENLFDDLEGTEVKEDVKKVLPAVKKRGSWDSEAANGMETARAPPVCANTCSLLSQPVQRKLCPLLPFYQ